MALPKKKKSEAKTSSVTVRLSTTVNGYLKTLASEHGLSQGDVISFLLEAEYKKWSKSKDSRG